MNSKNKLYITASSVLIGSCIGAGFLGIPYVTAKAGFFVSIFYLFFIGSIVLLINLYLGETALRTKGKHQLAGYAKKYLGKNAGRAMNFAMFFGIYSAIVAYLFGVGESLSFLFFGDVGYSVFFGVGFGLLVSILLWGGMSSLKKFEKIGVLVTLILFFAAFTIFVGKVDFQNLNYINFGNFLLPFGVILFALTSSAAIPEISLILGKKKELMKKVIFTGSAVSILFYLLFTFVVVGFKGLGTPEIATFALGTIFILLGIFTMFTSHLALGNALEENLELDEKVRKRKAWIISSLIPILIYVVVSFFDFFSFTKILSIGGVVSGGMIVILSLFIVKGAKKKGEREPEYSIPVNWWIIGFISFIIVVGVGRELLSIFLNW